MSEYSNGYLEHFGIRGMHWGQRRYQNSNGTYTSAGKKRRSVKVKVTTKKSNKETKKDRRQAVKNRRLLSDEELKSRVNRLQTEKQLKDLTADDLSPGKKFVKDVVETSGKKVAVVAAAGAMALAGKVVLEKMGYKTAADWMFQKPSFKK
jgi:predicted Zn-dependent protease